MMKNIIEVLKKYKISVYIALSIIIVGIIGIVLFNVFSNKDVLKDFENDNYVLKYDKSWSIKEKDDYSILLKQGSKAKIKIEIIELTDESKYSSIEDLIDEIIYNIEKQNDNYKLLSKKETTVSKYEYNGFKLLYENKDSQVMTTVYKKSDKLIMINYESDNDYFDILLDSVQNIIYNFDTKEKIYDLSNKIKVDTTDISYSTDEDLDSKLSESKTYEIANDNYYVKYSIPSNFVLSEFNSQSNYFNLKGIDNKDIVISAYIYKTNIFELLDKDNTIGVYNNYKTYKTDEDYSDFKETLTKLDSELEGYLYKNSYNYDKAVTYDKNFNKQEYKRKDENVDLIYALNKNHTLIIEIKAKGTSVTKKLIDSIKIKEVKNYSSYTTSTKKDNLLIGELKRYVNYDKKKIDDVILKLPDKYKEIQKYNNIYSERIYGLNYDEDNDIYDYEISYTLTSTSSKIDSQINNINSSFSKSYGEYNYLTQSDNISLNGNSFITYIGGYTNLGGIPFTNINRFRYYINKKVLFYEMSNGGYLMIEISGNGKEITDEILNDATNFEIKEIDN